MRHSQQKRKSLSEGIAQAGRHTGTGIAQMRAELRTRKIKPNRTATSTDVIRIDNKKIVNALERIAKTTLDRIRTALKSVFPIIARVNKSTSPVVGTHGNLKETGRESHHVPAAELVTAIHDQLLAVTQLLVPHTAPEVQNFAATLTQRAQAIGPFRRIPDTSLDGKGLSALLIDVNTHRECKLGNAVHKTFLADVIQKYTEQDVDPSAQQVVMVITPKKKFKRIEVNPDKKAWRSFLKGVHDMNNVVAVTPRSSALVEVTANENALDDVAKQITQALTSAPAGREQILVNRIRTDINTLTANAFAQALNGGISAVKAALAHSTKDGDHAKHPDILNEVRREASNIWGAHIIHAI